MGNGKKQMRESDDDRLLKKLLRNHSKIRRKLEKYIPQSWALAAIIKEDRLILRILDALGDT